VKQSKNGKFLAYTCVTICLIKSKYEGRPGRNAAQFFLFQSYWRSLTLLFSHDHM